MTFDVAVVGAGPAGSVLAATLARRGARVALIDASHPREKPCGGGFTGRALDLVAEHLPVSALAGVGIRAARFLDTPRGTSASVLLGAEHSLVVAGRSVADSALYDAAIRAGAVPVRARAVDIESRSGARVTLNDGQHLVAGCVVGADGVNSLVRRRLSRPFPREDLSVATGVYAHGVTSDEIVLELTHDPPGYIWSFPRRDHLAIGICAQASETAVGPLRATLTDWIERTGIARGARLESYSWPIPALTPAGFDRTELSGPDWMTIGDAAGLVDPITREGLFFALQSATFAADALTAPSLEEASRRYAEQVRVHIVSDLRIAATLKAGFFRPAFGDLLNDSVASSARVRAVMADLIAGTQPYRTLKRRLVGTFEFGLAWRWFRESRGRSAATTVR
jgi:geranylgeranyl reductase family protein